MKTNTVIACFFLAVGTVCAGGLISDAIRDAKPDGCVVEMTKERMMAWNLPGAGE